MSLLHHVPQSGMLPMHAQLTSVLDSAVATTEFLISDMYDNKTERDVQLSSDRLSSCSQLQVLLSFGASELSVGIVI